MRDLCIDTSTGASVAVVDDTGTYSARETDTRAHAERLNMLVQEVLLDAGKPSRATDANLDQVIVGTGPATFTGLRAGLVTARVIAHACGIPVRGVSSLDILARYYLDETARDGEIVVVTDARRQEVYWAHYRAAGPDDVECMTGPEVATADAVANRFIDSSVTFAGPGCALYPDALPTPMPVVPVHADIASRIVRARIAAGITDFPTEPLYLRRPDIHPGKAR
ncbi:MAG: tRNA (adenosine(37)-N6)-threonylcarbamoyltransferase complex dimerization subunit type 1 TsaB [Actinomycetaceae bacterium]|nr:tRNA (adenosine(37)-N6)-threonylcarbamoyltransferase complex dimerization subunit type 1 TsaB [Actinomycetaceae bacterium]